MSHGALMLISEVLSGSLVKEQENDNEPCVYWPESTV